MGFSIKRFFEDLQFILRDENIDEVDKLSALDELINRMQKYAEDCGQLRYLV